jgi:hypothetical protein
VWALPRDRRIGPVGSASTARTRSSWIRNVATEDFLPAPDPPIGATACALGISARATPGVDDLRAAISVRPVEAGAPSRWRGCGRWRGAVAAARRSRRGKAWLPRRGQGSGMSVLLAHPVARAAGWMTGRGIASAAAWPAARSLAAPRAGSPEPACDSPAHSLPGVPARIDKYLPCVTRTLDSACGHRPRDRHAGCDSVRSCSEPMKDG